MKPFKYLAPNCVSEAVGLLAEYGEKSVIMAGGTDVVVQLNERSISPEYVIHLDKIEELKFIKQDENSVRIGPRVTMFELEDSELIRENFTALAQAAEESAAPQVRNMGTIGGNLGTASPAGDLVTALMALDAQIKILSSQGERICPVEKFLTGPKKNILNKNELITEIIIPKLPPNSASAFQKLGKRKAMSISIVSAAASVTLDEKGSLIKDVKVSLGSVAPTVVRAKKFEDALKGKGIDMSNIKNAIDLIKEDIKPITDGRATAEYRLEVAGVLAARCLENSLTYLTNSSQ